MLSGQVCKLYLEEFEHTRGIAATNVFMNWQSKMLWEAHETSL